MSKTSRTTGSTAVPGWQFLQIPGPTTIPERVLNAMHRPAIDQRSAEWGRLAVEVLAGLKPVFKTEGTVIAFPSTGTGAWEAAIVNTLSAGDRVVMFDSGHFASLWIRMAKRFGLDVDVVATDWRHGPDPQAIEAKLAEDRGHAIKAVLIVHNETANGVTARLPEIRRAIDAARHPAMLFADTISSLGSIDYRMDEWGVDVTVAGSQKGLMLPPGLAFTAVSAKALAASKTATLPRCYWDWEWMLTDLKAGYLPYTPPMHLFFGLKESLALLMEEGLDQVFARHTRLAEATRAAASAWGLEIVCADAREYSDSVTALYLPEGHDADAFRARILARYGMSLGTGLGRFKGRVFRIGHMGWTNALMLCGALSGVELGLVEAGIPFRRSGVSAAIESIAAPAGVGLTAVA